MPLLKINETLNFKVPLTYETSSVGWILLVFKGAVILPVIAAFTWYGTREESRKATSTEVSANSPAETPILPAASRLGSPQPISEFDSGCPAERNSAQRNRKEFKTPRHNRGKWKSYFFSAGLALISIGIAIIVVEVRARQGTTPIRARVVGFSAGKSTNPNMSSFHTVAEYVGLTATNTMF